MLYIIHMNVDPLVDWTRNYPNRKKKMPSDKCWVSGIEARIIIISI